MTNSVCVGLLLALCTQRQPQCVDKQLQSSPSLKLLDSSDYTSDITQSPYCINWTVSEENLDLVLYVKVVSLDIDPSPNCTSSYIELFDGQYGREEQSLGRWCGSDQPTVYHATGQHILITLYSQRPGATPAFKLRYWSRLKPEVAKNLAGVIGGIAGFAIVALALGCYLSYRAREGARRLIRFPSLRVSPRRRGRRGRRRHRQRVFTVGAHRHPSLTAPPPSYDEVVAKDREHPEDVPPPSYNSLGCHPDSDLGISVVHPGVGKTNEMITMHRADGQGESQW